MTARWTILFIPLGIAIGSIPLSDNMNLFMRPLFGIAIVSSLFLLRDGLRTGERLWMGLLAVYMAVFLLSAMNSVVPEAALVNIGRQLFVMLLSFSLVMLFRDPETRVLGLRSLFIVLLSSAGLTAWVYLTLGGQYGLSYDGIRVIKGIALSDYTIGLNTLSYLAVVGLLAVRTAYRRSFWGEVLLLGGGVLVIFLLGSRATLLALIVSWLIFVVLRHLWRIAPILAIASIPIILGLAVASWMFVADYAVELRDVFGEDFLREISVGRTDMWGAGFRMWADSPLVGWGPDSWKALLLEFLPGADEQTLYVITNLAGGSFHNGFITVMAERGTLGLAAALAMQIYLFWCAFHVYFYRDRFSGYDARAAAAMPVLVLFMFIRSLAESSGLFGSANNEVDYITHFVSAYLVALHAYGLSLEQSPEVVSDGYEEPDEIDHSSVTAS